MGINTKFDYTNSYSFKKLDSTTHKESASTILSGEVQPDYNFVEIVSNAIESSRISENLSFDNRIHETNADLPSRIEKSIYVTDSSLDELGKRDRDSLIVEIPVNCLSHPSWSNIREEKAPNFEISTEVDPTDLFTSFSYHMNQLQKTYEEQLKPWEEESEALKYVSNILKNQSCIFFNQDMRVNYSIVYNPPTTILSRVEYSVFENIVSTIVDVISYPERLVWGNSSSSVLVLDRFWLATSSFWSFIPVLDDLLVLNEINLWASKSRYRRKIRQQANNVWDDVSLDSQMFYSGTSLLKRGSDETMVDPKEVQNLVEGYVDKVVLPSAFGIEAHSGDPYCTGIIDRMWSDIRLDSEAKIEIVKRLMLINHPFTHINEDDQLFEQICYAVSLLLRQTKTMEVAKKSTQMCFEIIEDMNYPALCRSLALSAFSENEKAIPVLEKILEGTRDHTLVMGCILNLGTLYGKYCPEKYPKLHRIEDTIDPKTKPDFS